MFVLIGAMLIVSPLSLFSYYGNLLPYLDSYYKARWDQISIPVDTLWPASVFRCTFTLSMIFTSPLELRFGIRRCVVAGLILLWASILSCYIAVTEPLALVVIFGGTHGTAVGLLYSTTLKLLLQSLPQKAGLASGFMASGPVLGALVNMGVAFAVINPSNEKPDLFVDNKVFFTDSAIVERVPNYFLVMGAIVAGSTLMGTILAFIGSASLVSPADSEPVGEHAPQNNQSNEKTGEVQDLRTETNGKQASKVFDAEISQPEAICEKMKIHGDVQEYNSISSLKNGDHSLNGRGEIKSSLEDRGGSTKLVVQAELSPWEALGTGKFWCIWLCYFCTSHTTFLHMNLYKQYGQLAISDDSMLVATGIVSMAGTILVRPCVGLLSDKIGIRKSTLVVSLLSCVFMSLMVIALRRSPWGYVVLVVIEFLSVSPQTMVFSLLTAFELGKIHCASNIGLVTTGNFIIMFLEPFLASTMVSKVGWDWLFLTGSLTAAVSMIVIMAVDFVWRN